MLDPRWRPTASISSMKMMLGAAGANANQNLDEFRAAYRVEWHACLARDSASEQGFTGSWRPHQQETSRDLATQPLELRRRLQEFNDLNQVILRLINACNIGKGGARPIL